MDWKFFLGKGGVLPSELDAVGGPGLGAAALLDVAGGRHHVLHRPVVVQVELMDHVLSVLDDSHLGMTGTSPKMPTKQGLVFGITLKFHRSLIPGFSSVGSFIIPNFVALPPVLLPSFGVIHCASLDPQHVQVGANWVIRKNVRFSGSNPGSNSCLNQPTITRSKSMESFFPWGFILPVPSGMWDPSTAHLGTLMGEVFPWDELKIPIF